MLEFCVLGSDPEAGLAVATAVGGIAYVANDATHAKAPFRSIVRAVVSDPSQLAPAADVATHLIFSRQIKSHDVSWERGTKTPGVSACFGLVHNEKMTHLETDAHWRDTHAPLALTHHAAMWDYVQLSVVKTLEGHELDGIAVCSFPTLADHDERFFNDAESEKIINADVSKFANLRSSPRPALLTEVVPA
ncbi:MAG: hypothetical protein ACI8TP_002855 [Acidimicrobiales bacterium]|jgi:hypothetical protein